MCALVLMFAMLHYTGFIAWSNGLKNRIQGLRYRLNHDGPITNETRMEIEVLMNRTFRLCNERLETKKKDENIAEALRTAWEVNETLFKECLTYMNATSCLALMDAKRLVLRLSTPEHRAQERMIGTALFYLRLYKMEKEFESFMFNQLDDGVDVYYAKYPNATSDWIRCLNEVEISE